MQLAGGGVPSECHREEKGDSRRLLEYALPAMRRLPRIVFPGTGTEQTSPAANDTGFVTLRSSFFGSLQAPSVARRILLAAVALTLFLQPKAVSQVVHISDPSLEQAIREAVDKLEGDLTDGDLQRLVILSAPRRGITTLEGFTNAPNLVHLDLSDNALTTVVLTTGFASLEYAMLRGNELTNVSATGPIPNLQQVGLSENYLQEVSFLKHLPQLLYLELDYNEITVFDPGADLSELLWLNLAFNRVQDLGFVSHLPRLTHLFLDDNGLESIAFPPGFTNLTWLTLDVNRIKDLAFLDRFPKLTNLELASNLAGSYVFPEGLTALDNLNLGENRLTNVVFAPDLTNLTVLLLDDNRFTELPNLLQLYSLKHLDLDINQFSRIVIPYSLTNLARLEVGFNPLVELILPEVLATNSLASLVTDLTNRGVTVLTYPFPPRLTSLSNSPTAGFEFVLRGMPGTYDVLRSTNLGSWTIEASITNASGVAGYSAAVSSGTGAVYYRARQR